MNEVHPHSIAIWIVLEKHERKSDGNLSGIPVEKKTCSGVIHLQNSEEATEKLEEITQSLKELIKNAAL